MNTIDLTSPEAALDYLNGLPALERISLPATGGEAASPVADAVRAITGESAHSWAANRGQWEWLAWELTEALEAQMQAPSEDVTPGKRFLTITSFMGASESETEHDTLDEALAVAENNNCTEYWTGQDSRTPARKGYEIKAIRAHADGPTFTFIFERA